MKNNIKIIVLTIPILFILLNQHAFSENMPKLTEEVAKKQLVTLISNNPKAFFSDFHNDDLEKVKDDIMFSDNPTSNIFTINIKEKTYVYFQRNCMTNLDENKFCIELTYKGAFIYLNGWRATPPFLDYNNVEMIRN